MYKDKQSDHIDSGRLVVVGSNEEAIAKCWGGEHTVEALLRAARIWVPITIRPGASVDTAPECGDTKPVIEAHITMPRVRIKAALSAAFIASLKVSGYSAIWPEAILPGDDCGKGKENE
jgi:hypothetical protein